MGPRLALSLIAAAIFPLDRLLAGMVAAGQGLEGICVYLGLSRTGLDEILVRLGLRTPHAGKLRKPSARGGWTALDVLRLIAWRLAGIHPETIGARLGRTTGAVRSKAYRLGVPAPERRLLRKVDPSTLADPPPDFGARGLGLRVGSATLAQHGAVSADSVGSSNGSAEASDVAAFRWPGPSDQGSEPAASWPDSTATVLHPAKRTRAAKSPASRAQRELPLLRVVPATKSAESAADPAAPFHESDGQTATGSVAAAPAAPVAAGQLAARPAIDLRLDAATRAAGDLTWIGGLKHIIADEEAVRLISMRYFGGEHWRRTAAVIGISSGILRTIQHLIDLPRDRARRKFGGTYDVECARLTLAGSGYELRRDERSRGFFWRHRSDRAVWFSRQTRKKDGEMSEYDKHASQLITLVTRRDFEADLLSGLSDSPARQADGSQPARHETWMDWSDEKAERIFKRSDWDFPTTGALQRSLIAAGRVAGEGPLAGLPRAAPVETATERRQRSGKASAPRRRRLSEAWRAVLDDTARMLSEAPWPRIEASGEPPRVEAEAGLPVTDDAPLVAQMEQKAPVLPVLAGDRPDAAVGLPGPPTAPRPRPAKQVARDRPGKRGSSHHGQQRSVLWRGVVGETVRRIALDLVRPPPVGRRAWLDAPLPYSTFVAALGR